MSAEAMLIVMVVAVFVAASVGVAWFTGVFKLDASMPVALDLQLNSDEQFL